MVWLYNRAPVTDNDEHPIEQDDDNVVKLEITDHIDLHGFRPRDIPSVVESYLEAARAKGFLTVRLIHGRGIGVQRTRVHSLLSRLPYVVTFNQAPTFLGGWGSTVVELLPAEEDDGETDR
jgi:dsDNA-specific endonuclease/ATPase MutS2